MNNLIKAIEYAKAISKLGLFETCDIETEYGSTYTVVCTGENDYVLVYSYVSESGTKSKLSDYVSESGTRSKLIGFLLGS